MWAELSYCTLLNFQVGDGISDDFLVNSDGDENFSRPLTIVEESASNSRRFQFFYSVGEIRRLPKDFTFPHMTLCRLITSWFCGNPSTKTLLFKFLEQCDMKDERTKRVFRKMRAMMDAVIAGAKQVDAWNAQHSTWEVPMALRL